MRIYLAIDVDVTDGHRKAFTQIAELLEEEIEAITLEVPGGAEPTIYSLRVGGVGGTRRALSESESVRGRR